MSVDTKLKTTWRQHGSAPIGEPIPMGNIADSEGKIVANLYTHNGEMCRVLTDYGLTLIEIAVDMQGK